MAVITKYVRIGEESKFGTKATELPEVIDPTSAGLDPAGDDKIFVDGIAGHDRRSGLGTYSTAGDIAIPLDDRVAGWFFKWAFGGYTVSGAADSFTHTFSPDLGGLMTSFTAAIGKDVFEHIFTGNVISEISLEAADEWAGLTVSVIGAKDEHGELLEEVVYTEGKMYTAPEGQLIQGADTDISADVNSVNLSISTGANVEDSSGFGSRFPTKAKRGGFEVNLELELVFEDLTELRQFWGGTNGPSVDTIAEEGYTLSFGDAIDIQLPRAITTSATQPADGRGTISQTLSLRGMYDDVEGVGPVEVHITNDVETYEIT